MPQLRLDAIVQTDLVEYLNTYSDFAFEIGVLKFLTDAGFVCEHAGTYEDPSTRKHREFDIRATMNFPRARLYLAVECKNVRSNFPLLISCLPRHKSEAFHEVAASFDPERNPFEKTEEPYSIAMLPVCKTIRLSENNSIYKAREFVGKSCDQVGRTAKNEISATDSDVYEKWAQALNSADDLTYRACTVGIEGQTNVMPSVVFPIVVVPNHRLWVTHFDQNGNRVREPEETDRCPYFVGREYFHKDRVGARFTISHLEFVTLSGLEQFIKDLVGDDKATNFTIGGRQLFQMMAKGQ